MNVEELFKECFKDEIIKAKKECRPTPWLTVREREFTQFCIEKERERCLSILEKYEESDVSAQNQLVWTALTFVWHEIKVEPKTVEQ